MFRSKFLWRLYVAFLLVIFVTGAAVGWLQWRWQSEDAVSSLRAELARAVETERMESLGRDGFARGAGDATFQQQIDAHGEFAGIRLTIIAADGLVLADSEEDPAAMDNHSARPEVVQAMDEGVGFSRRVSGTLDERYVYVARALVDGDAIQGVVRASAPEARVTARHGVVVRNVALGAFLAVGLASLVGFLLARRFTIPVRSMTRAVDSMVHGNYQVRADVEGTDEVAQLAASFNSLASELATRVATITTDRNRLRAILSSMVEGVIAVDANERVVHINEVAARLFEVQADDVVGQLLWQVLRLDELTSALSECLLSDSFEVREVMVPDEFQDRIVTIHGAPLVDEDGRREGAVLVLHEVTRLRRLEGMRRDFVANVSHELKTPLAAIQGLCETMIEDPEMPGELRQRFLGKIRAQCNRQTALVTDLLTLSRLDADEGAADMATCDLRFAVEESVRGLRHVAEGKGLNLDAAVSSDVMSVRGAPGALQQVVENLISNAIKYTPEGGQVTVRLAREGERAVLAVVDTGIGIPLKHQQRVFERFYRVDKARSRDLGGTGLGLAIVKNIVMRLGGSVDLISAPGEGSTFRVEFPVV